MSTDVNPAYLVIGPLAGVAVGFIMSEFRSQLSRRSRRKALATALLVEMTDQAQWIVSYGNIWNRVAKDRLRISSMAAFKSRPKPSLVYVNTLGEIPQLLDSKLTSRIIQFHANIEYISKILDSWYDHQHELTDNDGVRIAGRWRAACMAAADSIQALRLQANVHPIGEESNYLLEAVLEFLRKVGSNELIDPSNEPLLQPLGGWSNDSG